MNRRTGLGKGLGALIEQEASLSQAPQGVLELPLGSIDPNENQPRKDFDEAALQDLAASIAQHGVLQPLIVSPRGGRYSIIAGERRWRAARMAGLATIPVIISDADEEKRMEIALIENLQREDLNPVEQAMGFRSLIDEFHMTQETLAQRMGKSRSAVANALRLLQLPEEVLALLREGTLSEGHGRALVALGDPAKQREAAHRIAKQGWTVRQTEQWVRAAHAKREKPRAESGAPEELEPVAEALRQAFGTRVFVQGTPKSGKITIVYYSPEDLERIYEYVTED